MTEVINRKYWTEERICEYMRELKNKGMHITTNAVKKDVGMITDNKRSS